MPTGSDRSTALDLRTCRGLLRRSGESRVDNADAFRAVGRREAFPRRCATSAALSRTWRRRLLGPGVSLRLNNAVQIDVQFGFDIGAILQIAGRHLVMRKSRRRSLFDKGDSRKTRRSFKIPSKIEQFLIVVDCRLKITIQFLQILGLVGLSTIYL